MPRKLTLKRREINGCPFKAGDVVRPKKDCTNQIPSILTVTSVRLIPDISSRSYGSDVRKLPFWLYGVDQNGKKFTGINMRCG